MTETTGSAETEQDALARLIRHAWADEAFKARLLADPAEALQSLGGVIPADRRIEFYDDPAATLGSWSSITEGATTVLRVPIPARPEGGTASASELADIGGGNFLSDFLDWLDGPGGDAWIMNHGEPPIIFGGQAQGTGFEPAPGN